MQVGDRFERRLRWTKDEIAAFARETGDFNPVHHDETFAEGTRFGGLIAAGGQPVAFLLGIAGSSASRESPGVGLEFTFQFRGAVFPNEALHFWWDVVAIEPSERPRGTAVRLEGGVRGEDARDIIIASGRTLLVEQL